MEIYINICYLGVFINVDFNFFKYVRCLDLFCIVFVIFYVLNI